MRVRAANMDNMTFYVRRPVSTFTRVSSASNNRDVLRPECICSHPLQFLAFGAA
jgi:hypothetical protein